MFFLKRRRLFFWLLKAYLKKWGTTIGISFIVGLMICLIIILNLNTILSILPISQTQNIGLVGSFRIDELPSTITDKLSMGLTRINEKGEILPAIANKWDIRDNGKTYVFYLNKNLKFNNGDPVDSYNINYGFSNVDVERPSKYILIYKLHDSYSPFLVTVSRKIYTKNFIGVGEYKIKNLKINGDFVQSIEIQSIKNPRTGLSYQFYPTQEALKTSFMLGEIDEMKDINTLSFNDLDLRKFKNLDINKVTNYNRLVTLFYNTQDKVLSDKRIRKALSYATPNNFRDGLRNETSYSPLSWANQSSTDTYDQDFAHSKLLISEAASKEATLKLTIKTLPQYRDVAGDLATDWKNANITTTIETVDSVPTDFQIFLGEFFVPKDPDQYTLWHTGQAANITNYKNLRIDKLLEDGRKTVDINERKKIYADFEKYLIDDSPATFLFFPYTFEVKRKAL